MSSSCIPAQNFIEQISKYLAAVLLLCLFVNSKRKMMRAQQGIGIYETTSTEFELHERTTHQY
jgi:hypothetical protein